MNIPATQRLVTRPWPSPAGLPKPELQVRSTHAARCHVCGTEVRINPGEFNADLFGGCGHLEAIEKSGSAITLRFTS